MGSELLVLDRRNGGWRDVPRCVAVDPLGPERLI